MKTTEVKTSKTKKNINPKKKINLALQGGGSHGAFTWGVVDYLLADGRVEIDGISGTSAGAMNASVLAYGLRVGGADFARESLYKFWHEIAVAGKNSLLQPSVLDKLASIGNMDFSPSYNLFEKMTKLLSPYELNPTNINPLREVLQNVVDFSVFKKKNNDRKLFITATNVCNGRMKVFANQEVTIEAVLASACLPLLFQAVEINGEYYWDGGYMGNPPLFPLINETSSPDILIIQINPVNILQHPTTVREIIDRTNTLAFNSSLMRELRAVHFVTKLIDNGELSQDKHKRVFIHTIEAEPIVQNLDTTSKLNSDWDFLQYLFECGQQLAKDFLDNHFNKIGHESSTNIEEKFM